jgi:hypothetical protein
MRIILTHIPNKMLADKDDTKTLFSCNRGSFQSEIFDRRLLHIFCCKFGTHTSSFPESKEMNFEN